MNITGINGVSTGMQSGMKMGNSMQMDSVSKNIQNQIVNAQKKLQDLSANEELSLEDKMKKRQEIQQEITNLNQQLRQHQMEQRKEKQQKVSSMDDMLGGSCRSNGAKGDGQGMNAMSQATMTAIISADGFQKQAQVQGAVATKMEGRAGVLESEIKMDKGRMGSTEVKEAELAEAEAKAQAATSAQLSTLADANKTMEEATKADSKAETTEKKTDRTEEGNDKNTENKVDGVTSDENATEGVPSEADKVPVEQVPTTQSVPTENNLKPTPYVSVDVRL